MQRKRRTEEVAQKKEEEVARPLKRGRMETTESPLLDLPIETLFLIFDAVLDGTPFVPGLGVHSLTASDGAQDTSLVVDKKIDEAMEVDDTGREKEEADADDDSEEEDEEEEEEEEEDEEDDEDDDEEEDEEDEEDDEERKKKKKAKRKPKRLAPPVPDPLYRHLDLKAILAGEMQREERELAQKSLLRGPNDNNHSQDLLQSACEHLVRCFFFSCKQLNAALVAYRPLWQKLYRSLVSPCLQHHNDSVAAERKRSKKKNKRDDAGKVHTTDPELRTLLQEKETKDITFELYRSIIHRFRGTYEYAYNGPLGETEEDLKLRIGAFGRAAWAAFGVGCGRAGEYFSLNCLRGWGYLFLGPIPDKDLDETDLFLKREDRRFGDWILPDDKAILAAVQGDTYERNSSCGRSGRGWSSWVLAELYDLMQSQPPCQSRSALAEDEDGSADDAIKLHFVRSGEGKDRKMCSASLPCNRWESDMEW